MNPAIPPIQSAAQQNKMMAGFRNERAAAPVLPSAAEAVVVAVIKIQWRTAFGWGFISLISIFSWIKRTGDTLPSAIVDSAGCSRSYLIRRQ